MRRKDREITDIRDILSIIDKCHVMRVAFVDGAIPYIVPLNFGYHLNDKSELTFYFHCAKEGRKLEIIKTNSQVCFEADCSFELIKNQNACNWTATYESVIGNGTLEVVTGEDEKQFGMASIMGKYGFDGLPEFTPAVFARTLILRLVVSQVSGKSNILKK